MADRTVTTRLRLDVRAFSTGAGKAQRDLSGLNKKMTDTAGFAKGMRKALEDATKRLPKIEIDANTSPAEVAIAQVRARLEALSGKEIGVDIDATAALVEMAALQAELEELEKDTSFEVRADVSRALADLQKVVREAQRVDGQTVGVDVEVRGGAFAQKLRAQVEAAARSLPAVPITADSSPAERAVEALRARLEALSGKTVGVDVDAASAMAEIREIEAQLAALASYAPTVDVRADTAAALAQLQAVNSEVSRLDGRTANVRVNADTAGALTAIAAVSAALASIPSVASVTVGVAGLGAAFSAAAAGAGAFAAAVIPGIGRASEALKDAEKSAGGAGGAVKSAGEKAAEAAAKALRLAEAQDRVKDAAQAVKAAQQGVRDALANVTRAQADVARAAEDAATRQAAAAARIESAERAVQDAHRATQRAIEDLTRARERAQERLEDLALATERGALTEERARLNIERARADLAKVQADPEATSLDRAEADLRLREAELSLREIQERNEDLAKERAEADRKGVEGSDEVVAAKERILAAQQREADAERALAEARETAARVAVEGQRKIAEANERVALAQRKVGEAQQQVIKAQRDAQRAAERYKLEQLQAAAATTSAGGAAGGAASKMSELSKQERELADNIKDFKEAYEDWQRSLQPDLFPVLSKGMKLVEGNLNRISPLARAAGKGFNTLLDDAKSSLDDPVWSQWIAQLSTHIPGAITGLGRTGGNVFKGLTGTIVAFLPTGQKIIDWLEDGTEKFAKWGTGLQGSPEFERFLAYASEAGPKVVEIVGNLVELAGKLVQVGAEPGQGVLDLLVGLSEKLANISPEQLRAIATGIGLIWAAANLGKSIKWAGLVLLADIVSELPPSAIYALAGAIAAVKAALVIKDLAGGWASLRGEITKTGDAADGAKGKLGGLGGTLKTLASATVIGAAAAGFGALDRSIAGLNPGVETLANGISKLVREGKTAPELLDQVVGKIGLIDATPLAGLGSGTETLYGSMARLTSSGVLDEVKTGLMEIVDSSGLVTLDKGRERIANLDQALTAMVSSGRADEAARFFAGIAKGAEAQGIPMEKLRELFPQYAQAVGSAAGPTGEMATAAQQVAEKIGSADQALAALKGNLDIFNGKTDVARASLELKKSFDDAKAAIDNANGSLDLAKAKTDKQREAVILARDQFSGYIGKVIEIADAQSKLTGNTGDASKTIAEQLPKLFDLAGKNKEAREQVLLLAEAYGISREDAIKAAKGGEDLREVLAKIKSKSIRIEADTKPALDTINQLITTASGKVIRIGVDVRSDTQEHGARAKAAGGILTYPGAVETYAAGGLRTPNVASAPTVLYGEGRGPEAFIPYDPAFRKRALGILGQVAEEFGLEIVPAGAAGAGGWLEMLERMGLLQMRAAGGITSSGPGGPSGAVREVTSTLSKNTNLIGSTLTTTARDVVYALGDTSSTVSASLTATATTLQGTWGKAAADVSTSISRVSEAEVISAGKLVTATGGLADTVKTQIKSLQDVVLEVAKAVAAAADQTTSGKATAKGAKAGSASGKAASDVLSAVTGALSKTAAGKAGALAPKQPANTIAGSQPDIGATEYDDRVLTTDTVWKRAAGGIDRFERGGLRPGVARGPVALFGEGGAPEAFIPYDPAHRRRAEGLVQQVASDFGMSVTRMPTYQRSAPSTTFTMGGSGGSGGGPVFDQKAFFAELRKVVASAGVSFPNAVIRETADIDQLMQRAAYRTTSRPTA